MNDRTIADRLAQFELAAAIEGCALVIRRGNLRCSYSGRQFAEVSFPGVDGVEARLLPSGVGEIKIGGKIFAVSDEDAQRPSLPVCSDD